MTNASTCADYRISAFKTVAFFSNASLISISVTVNMPIYHKISVCLSTPFFQGSHSKALWKLFYLGSNGWIPTLDYDPSDGWEPTWNLLKAQKSASGIHQLCPTEIQQRVFTGQWIYAKLLDSLKPRH